MNGGFPMLDSGSMELMGQVHETAWPVPALVRHHPLPENLHVERARKAVIITMLNKYALALRDHDRPGDSFVSHLPRTYPDSLSRDQLAHV
jgi:hypothetical protein